MDFRGLHPRNVMEIMLLKYKIDRGLGPVLVLFAWGFHELFHDEAPKSFLDEYMESACPSINGTFLDEFLSNCRFDGDKYHFTPPGTNHPNVEARLLDKGYYIFPPIEDEFS